MNTPPNQTASESALAVAADSHDTPPAGCALCAFPEVVAQLSRIAAALERQTAEQRGVISMLRTISADIGSLTWWVSHKPAPRTVRKSKTGGRS